MKVRPGEGARTLVLFLQYFFAVASGIAGKSARDTFFLSRYDRSYLPLMFAVCAIAVALAAALYSRLAKRLPSRLLLDASNAAFIVVLLALGSRLEGHTIPLLYVWVEIIVTITTLSFWLSASEVFDPRQAKRLFGLIGGGGSAAAIFVGAGIKPCAKAFGSESLLWLVAGTIVAQWALARYSMRFSAGPASLPAPPRQSASGRRFDPYLASIALVIALSALVSQVVDFQFKMFAADAMRNEVELASYFGHFYSFTGAATLTVQFFVTSALLSRFGILAGLLTLPIFLGVGAAAVLFRPVLTSAAIGKFADQSLKFTLNNSSLELLWLPVPPVRRKAVRPVIGGAIKSIAECAAGLSMFLLIGYTGLRYLSLIPMAAFGVWIFTVFRLRTLYVKALITAIEKRQIDVEDLALDAQDPAFVGMIESTLRSSDEERRLLALELIGGLPLASWSAALRICYGNGTNAVRQRILQLAANDPDVLPDSLVMEALHGAEPVAVEAIRTAGARRLKTAEPVFRELLQDERPGVRAAAAVALYGRNEEDKSTAAGLLIGLVEGADAKGRAAALIHLPGHEEILPLPLLSAVLRDPEREVRECGLRVAARVRDDSMLPDIIGCLDDPRTAPEAQAALQAVLNHRTLPGVRQALLASAPGSRRKTGFLNALAGLPAETALPVLLDSISPDDLESSAQATRSMILLARKQAFKPVTIERLQPLASKLLHNAYYCNRLLVLLGPGQDHTLLGGDLAERIRQTVQIILCMEVVRSADRSLGDAVMIASERDPAKLPLLLELLDNVLDQEKRGSLLPLVEPLNVETRDRAGTRIYGDLPSELEPELQRGVYSRREWLSAITIDHLWRTNRTGLLAVVDWNEVPDFRLIHEVRAVVEGRLSRMYSTLEKTIMLKSVSLFADVPAEKLAKIAQIAEEGYYPMGTVVMREGEFGDSLFIVADGAVMVRKSGQDLAQLKKGDCAGEMALLDHSPRSADVVVTEDAALLRIGREDFNAVTEANPEILQGIVRLLTRRLREANEKLTSLSSDLAKERSK